MAHLIFCCPFLITVRNITHVGEGAAFILHKKTKLYTFLVHRFRIIIIHHYYHDSFVKVKDGKVARYDLWCGICKGTMQHATAK